MIMIFNIGLYSPELAIPLPLGCRPPRPLGTGLCRLETDWAAEEATAPPNPDRPAARRGPMSSLVRPPAPAEVRPRCIRMVRAANSFGE